MPFSGKCQSRSFQLDLNRIPEPAEKEAQKKRNDTIQTVPAFSNAEVPFYLAPFTGFLPFQFLLLLLDRRICVGLPKFGTIQMDSVFLAVSHVLSRPEDRISKHSFRIVSVGFPVGFH
jgi:hypothetical protein